MGQNKAWRCDDCGERQDADVERTVDAAVTPDKGERTFKVCPVCAAKPRTASPDERRTAYRATRERITAMFKQLREDNRWGVWNREFLMLSGADIADETFSTFADAMKYVAEQIEDTDGVYEICTTNPRPVFLDRSSYGWVPSGQGAISIDASSIEWPEDEDEEPVRKSNVPRGAFAGN